MERSTLDIDAAVWAPQVDLNNLVERLDKHGIKPRIPDAVRFARQNQILLLQHQPSRVRLDLGLAWLPFEENALARAAKIDFAGVSATVVQPEDLIVYKTVAWRDRDRDDIQKLLRRHEKEVNLDTIRARVSEFAIALEEPERVHEFERLVKETFRFKNFHDDEKQ